MKLQGVNVPTLVPELPPRPAQATLPVTWTQKMKQPGFWLVVAGTVIQFIQLLPLSASARAIVAAAGVTLGKMGVDSALEFPPSKIPWTEAEKWGESYRRVYAGLAPIRGYRPGFDEGDPFAKRSAPSLFDEHGGGDDPTPVDRPAMRPTTAVPLPPPGDPVPGSSFNDPPGGAK